MTSKTRFDGAIQILRYNWPKYLGAVIVLLTGVTLVVVITLPTIIVWLLLGAMTLAAFWLMASLAVSHLVYDRSGLYSFDWLSRCFDKRPKQWILIHAGLDESTSRIERSLETSPAAVLDIYEPELMPERSITRARSDRRFDARSQSASHHHLPIEDESCDAAFLLFVAHELRTSADRQSLFRELRRVLCDDGRIILVEHIRDVMNSIVFGPGVFHFWPRSLWMHDIDAASLKLEDEFSITPFASAYVIGPKCEGPA